MPAPLNTVSSRELSAFAHDAGYHLEEGGLLRVAKVTKTGDPRCALKIACIALGNYPTGSIVAEEIERVWHEAPLGFGGADLIDTDVRPHLVTANFVAQSDDLGTVTGKIEVRLQVSTEQSSTG